LVLAPDGRGRGENGAECARAPRGGAADLGAARGRIVKTTGDGLLLEFPSVVAAVEGAIAIQTLMAERNADAPEAKRVNPKVTVNFDAWESARAS
jgi:hypothetical protein